MKERPILFSGPMVRAILERRKTQTRRVVKPQPFMVLSAADWHSRAMSGVDPYGCRPMGSHVLEEMGATCPHGTVGDRLWGREAFKVSDVRHAPDDHGTMIYTADSTSIEIDGSEFDMNRIKLGKSYPSIHMPRWASRITLEITGVRVERLREISERDAIAEGCICPNYGIDDYWKKAGDPDTPSDVFMELWQSINGPKSWAANPWVWVIEFRRVTCGK